MLYYSNKRFNGSVKLTAENKIVKFRRETSLTLLQLCLLRDFWPVVIKNLLKEEPEAITVLDDGKVLLTFSHLPEPFDKAKRLWSLRRIRKSSQSQKMTQQKFKTK